MNKDILRLLVYLASCLVVTSSCSAKVPDDTSVSLETKLLVGEDLSLCKGCPLFVRVPSAPNSIRPIHFVSKYELTWNNYLAAHDAGSCEIPNPNHSSQAKNDILANLEKFRIDWPVGQLGVDDVQCYINWLQEKTGYLVSLPTGAEWEWFARAGREGAKFPWGNSPDPQKEALYGSSIESANEVALEYGSGGKHVTGVKVGMFEPNDWGIFDVMGNAIELTSEMISGEDWYRTHPQSEFAKQARDKARSLLKGSHRYDQNWINGGISDKSYAVISDGRYSTDVALRLVLIERKN